MENNSLEVLKLFTRKLVNCRYKISAAKVAEYLNKGKFGYTFDKTGDNLITNDSVFADDVALVVDRIRAIYAEPHISLKKEELVQNVSVASKYDNRSIAETYKDEKLWKVKMGEAAPEFIHTYVHEDNLAIYENCFVTALLDYLLDAITRKLGALCGNIQTFNRKIDAASDVNAYSTDEYVKYTKSVEEIPVLASLDDPETNVISSLIKSRSILTSLKTYEIYKACKKVGFDLANLYPTNTLLKDADYNYCYVFYIAYMQNKRYLTTQSKMYQGFVVVNTVSAILDSGFTIDENAQYIAISDTAELKFDSLIFRKNLFTLNLSLTKEGEMVIDVTENPDGETAKYVFKIISSSLTDELEGRSPEEYAKYLDDNRKEGVTREFLITDIPADSDDIVSVFPDKLSARANLVAAIKTITMLVQGVTFIHTKYCPVCGTQLIAPENKDYVCSNCNSTYHIFNYELHDFIWIKRLPNIVEKRAKTDDRVTVKTPTTPADEVAAAGSAEERVKRRVLTKSFEGKMRQATKEQIAFYNELKNYLLSFKRVNSRTSWSCDSFNIGREKAVKIGFRGQTMVAYFALNPADYADTKYYPHDVSDKKKFEDTPMMVKIKSERGVKFAKELIDVICRELTPKKDFVPEVYRFDYMSDKKLIEQGLAKESFVNI